MSVSTTVVLLLYVCLCFDLNDLTCEESARLVTSACKAHNRRTQGARESEKEHLFSVLSVRVAIFEMPCRLSDNHLISQRNRFKMDRFNVTSWCIILDFQKENPATAQVITICTSANHRQSPHFITKPIRLQKLFGDVFMGTFAILAPP